MHPVLLPYQLQAVVISVGGHRIHIPLVIRISNSFSVLLFRRSLFACVEGTIGN